jgi:hypothetical protein
LLEFPAYRPVLATVTGMSFALLHISYYHPIIIDMVRIGHKLWGGHPNSACEAAHPTDYWRCYFGVVVHPFITVPMLYHEETQDSAQLILNGLTGVSTPEELAYLNAWRSNMTMALRTITPPSAVYAPACLWHCSVELTEFRTIHLSNNNYITLQDALHWYVHIPIYER